jgi:hypothetical protein
VAQLGAHGAVHARHIAAPALASSTSRQLLHRLATLLLLLLLPHELRCLCLRCCLLHARGGGARATSSRCRSTLLRLLLLLLWDCWLLLQYRLQLPLWSSSSSTTCIGCVLLSQRCHNLLGPLV